METKKPLIGVSILAVVLLVVSSLSNVVGYQSVKSTVNDSPLFETRTQRATNQQQNIITSQYLGKGKGNLLQFPNRDNLIESLKEAIVYISQMDEQTFARFTQLCIQRIHQNSSFDNTDDKVIKQVLQVFRDGPIRFNLSAQNHTYNMQTSDICPLTYNNCFPTLNPWYPGCLIVLFFAWIIQTIEYWLYLSPQIIRFIIACIIDAIVMRISLLIEFIGLLLTLDTYCDRLHVSKLIKIS